MAAVGLPTPGGHFCSEPAAASSGSIQLFGIFSSAPAAFRRHSAVRRGWGGGSGQGASPAANPSGSGRAAASGATRAGSGPAAAPGAEAASCVTPASGRGPRLMCRSHSATFCRLSILLRIYQPRLRGPGINRWAGRCEVSLLKTSRSMHLHNSAGISTSQDRAFVLCHCQQIPGRVGSGFQCTISTQPFPSRAPENFPVPFQLQTASARILLGILHLI